MHQQHPWVAQPQSLCAWGQLFPGLALQGCCLEPLWTLPQPAWEQCCCLMLVCLSPLQQEHLELGMMWLWLALHHHCPWQDPLCAPLAQGTGAACAKWWWEPERRWSGGWQRLERRPQPLALPGGCLALPDPRGELPRWEALPAHHWSWLGPAFSPSPVAPGCLRSKTRQTQLDQPHRGPSRQEPARGQLPASLT